MPIGAMGESAGSWRLELAEGWVPVELVRHRRARRYVLRVGPDGRVRVTVPRWGTLDEACRFAQRHTAWVHRQRLLRAASRPARVEWRPGASVLYRGVAVPLTVRAEGSGWVVRLGDCEVAVAAPDADHRAAVEGGLWRLAGQELPGRVLELAAVHGLRVGRVSVRNQRSRWGSCSRRGTVCLNWRLVQAPEYVRDYVILHELMHLRHMNHSQAFWRAVIEACPRHAEAREWLRRNEGLLR